ncbi:dynactin subunit p25-like [Cryptosporidium canis]|uniref:Dynactin subunit 5 n=1 Tax=Cryptosporidium canis TaxID=195482 RepID=A0A9D5DJK5_9CRYT|nr:dynactin subunit p25-like [Cryptosporidium canis]
MIRIGQYVILESNCIIRPCFKKIKGKYGSVPISIGDCVQIGENSVVMASSIGSNVYIGKNAIIGSGTIIKDNCIILPDTTIAPNTLIPPFTEWGGTPGVMLRRLPESQNVLLQQSAVEYYNNFQLVSNKAHEEQEKVQHSNTILVKSMKTGVSSYYKNDNDKDSNYSDDTDRKSSATNRPNDTGGDTAGHNTNGATSDIKASQDNNSGMETPK